MNLVTDGDTIVRFIPQIRNKFVSQLNRKVHHHSLILWENICIFYYLLMGQNHDYLWDRQTMINKQTNVHTHTYTKQSGRQSEKKINNLKNAVN